MTEEELRLMFQRSDKQEAAQPKPKVRAPWFVRAPRCPHCGTAMVELYAGVRDAWKGGVPLMVEKRGRGLPMADPMRLG
jgi:hypothetical protein